MAKAVPAPNAEDNDAQPLPGAVVMPAPAAEPMPPTLFAESSQAATPSAVPTGLEPPAEGDPGTITWTASEFIAHDKGAGWYLGLAAVAAICAILIYLITKDMVSPGVVLVAALLLGIYGARQPRQVEYRLDRQGITVGSRHFPYDSFRSFSVIPEGAFSSIVFMPLKRFALPLTLYYAPDDEDNIVSILSDQLPHEERRPDAVDRLMRRIRF